MDMMAQIAMCKKKIASLNRNRERERVQKTRREWFEEAVKPETLFPVVFPALLLLLLLLHLASWLRWNTASNVERWCINARKKNRITFVRRHQLRRRCNRCSRRRRRRR